MRNVIVKKTMTKIIDQVKNLLSTRVGHMNHHPSPVAVRIVADGYPIVIGGEIELWDIGLEKTRLCV